MRRYIVVIAVSLAVLIAFVTAGVLVGDRVLGAGLYLGGAVGAIMIFARYGEQRREE